MKCQDAILTINNVTMRFGGMVALNGITSELYKDEILGLIGPNGAGKTTLFNVISGGLKPTAGQVKLHGKKITGLEPHRICQAGIGRTFQIVRPFPTMTVRENVAVGAMASGLSVRHAMDKAQEILEKLHMAHLADKYPGMLTLSEKKRVEVARALSGSPEILLLDEVMAGLNLQEMSEFTELIRDIHAQGITIVLVEHIMQAVVALCNRVIVLNFGEILTSGTPEEVMNDKRVISAYLGEGYNANN